jgi:ferritin-like metal-binding protein YciE
MNTQSQAQDMSQSSLHQLFIEELKDILWAEKHLVKNLPKVAEKATSAELKQAITSHLRETEGHVKRLEQVFKSINEEPDTQKCDAMAGLVDETNEMIGDTEDGTLTRDVAIISCAQKVEHYEIAAYGTLKTLAQTMGNTAAVQLLEATLAEEKKADEKLTEVGVTKVNKGALNEKIS